MTRQKWGVIQQNSRYDNSAPESGKNIPAHKNISYWDYFLKTVQIDGSVFDVIVNVRKGPSGEYVYSLQLNENKIKAASPVARLISDEELNGVPTASAKNIPQNQQNSNTDSHNSARDIPEMATKAEKHFGITNDAKESGYISVNGNYLDFSGRHWGGNSSGHREVDHADVSEILPPDFDTYAVTHNGKINRSGLMATYEFEKYGFIRIQPETESIELAVMPSKAQQNKLISYIKSVRGTTSSYKGSGIT